MIQQILPGLESFMGYPQEEIIFENAQRFVDTYIEKGFQFLTDINSGKIFFRDGESQKPYIPERVVTPSGKIYDECELIEELRTTRPADPERKELEDAYYFWNAIFHPEIDGGEYRWNGPTFLDDSDEKETLEKYLRNPFWDWEKTEAA